MKIPTLSAKERIVLDLLRSQHEMFGLEMVKASEGALKRGTIYVTLQRMSEKGFVDSKQEKSPTDAGMPRRVYRITGDGQRVLNAVEAGDAAARASFGGLGYA